MKRLLIWISLVTLTAGCVPDLSRITGQSASPLPQNPGVSVATLPPSPSHSPETLITTIKVIDNLHKPQWRLRDVLADWNKVKYVNFQITQICMYYEPCVTVSLASLTPTKPGEITVGQADWGEFPWDMSIKLNPLQLSNQYAQSTLCHEFGHIIGLGHVKVGSISKIKTCMEADDDYAPVSPSYFDIKLADRLGPWSWEKSQETSGREIDGKDVH